MLVVQLQHLVIEQLQEVNLQRCSWKPICSLGKNVGLIMCYVTQHYAHAKYTLRDGSDSLGSMHLSRISGSIARTFSFMLAGVPYL